MKTTVSSYDFIRAFEECRPNNFSREGLNILFDWCEEYEQSTGEEMELDVIALCCDFSEEDYKAIADNYGIDLPDDTLEYFGDEEYKKACIEAVRDYLNDNTCLIGEPSEGVFLFQQF